MDLCIYVSMYVCIYVCMFLCMYVSMYVCMYVYVYACMYNIYVEIFLERVSCFSPETLSCKLIVFLSILTTTHRVLKSHKNKMSLIYICSQS